MCSYEKWANPPRRDLTWFCRDPTKVRVFFKQFLNNSLLFSVTELTRVTNNIRFESLINEHIHVIINYYIIHQLTINRF